MLHPDLKIIINEIKYCKNKSYINFNFISYCEEYGIWTASAKSQDIWFSKSWELSMPECKTFWYSCNANLEFATQFLYKNKKFSKLNMIKILTKTT